MSQTLKVAARAAPVLNFCLSGLRHDHWVESIKRNTGLRSDVAQIQDNSGHKRNSLL